MVLRCLAFWTICGSASSREVEAREAKVSRSVAAATDLDTFASLASTSRLEALPQIVQKAKHRKTTSTTPDASLQSKNVPIPMASVPGTKGKGAHRKEDESAFFDDATLAPE